MNLKIENGWTVIETCGMTLRFPAESDSMADDRVEISCGGSRLFVESHEDGPLVSAIEKVAE
jgi:hypothetical protein